MICTVVYQQKPDVIALTIITGEVRISDGNMNMFKSSQSSLVASNMNLPADVAVSDLRKNHLGRPNTGDFFRLPRGPLEGPASSYPRLWTYDNGVGVGRTYVYYDGPTRQDSFIRIRELQEDCLIFVGEIDEVEGKMGELLKPFIPHDKERVALITLFLVGASD